MKTLAEALEVFTSEEVVSFKWDKEVNADTGRRTRDNASPLWCIWNDRCSDTAHVDEEQRCGAFAPCVDAKASHSVNQAGDEDIQ